MYELGINGYTMFLFSRPESLWYVNQEGQQKLRENIKEEIDILTNNFLFKIVIVELLNFFYKREMKTLRDTVDDILPPDVLNLIEEFHHNDVALNDVSHMNKKNILSNIKYL